MAKKKKGAFAEKIFGLVEEKTACEDGSFLFTIAGSNTIVLDEIADQLRAEIDNLPPGVPLLAKQGLGEQTGVKEAIVVVRDQENPHTHPESDLIIFVLSGGGFVQLFPGEADAPVGSTVVIPKGVCHAYHNTSPNDSVIIATFSPIDSDPGACQ